MRVHARVRRRPSKRRVVPLRQHVSVVVGELARQTEIDQIQPLHPLFTVPHAHVPWFNISVHVSRAVHALQRVQHRDRDRARRPRPEPSAPRATSQIRQILPHQLHRQERLPLVRRFQQ